jgi:hypothetical protein
MKQLRLYVDPWFGYSRVLEVRGTGFSPVFGGASFDVGSQPWRAKLF